MIRNIVIFFTPVYAFLFYMLLAFCGISAERIGTINTILTFVLFIPLYVYLIWNILSQSWGLWLSIFAIIICIFFWGWAILGFWSGVLAFALSTVKIKSRS